jgi:hypothetical protein
MTFTATVSGTATNVSITVYNRATGAVTMTVPLSAGATAGGVTTWSASGTAPGTRGEYRYSATAQGSGGDSTIMPGVSGWTFCVGDPSVDCTG